jgi:phospholipase/carboxylesterase
MAHGSYDDIIPIERARKSREVMTQLGYTIDWHEYPMPHSVCPEEIADISAFLARLL